MSAETVQLLRDPQCFIASSSSDRKGDLAGGLQLAESLEKKKGEVRYHFFFSQLAFTAYYICCQYTQQSHSTQWCIMKSHTARAR